MKLKSFSLLLALTATAATGFSATPAANHLVISELGIYAPSGFSSSPNSAEFTEIYNPTNQTIDLTNYYISDYNLYFHLPSIVAGQVTNTLTNGSDFLVKMPAGTSIPPGGVVVIACNGTKVIESFFDGTASNFYNQPGNPQLFEIYNSSPTIPDIAANFNASAPEYTLDRGGTAIDAAGGYNMSHTDGGENTVLFYWDGQGPLVKDVDMVEWLYSNDSWGASDNQIVDKTGTLEQGPNNQQGTYGFDFGTYVNMTVPYSDRLNVGQLVRRSLLEVGETHTSGNGIGGDDETLEENRLTWHMVPGAPSNGSPGLVDFSLGNTNQPPVIGTATRSIQNPVPGDTVHISAKVYDDGVFTPYLVVDKGTGFTTTTMTNEGTDQFGANISTTGLAQGTHVKWFVSAVDAGGKYVNESMYQPEGSFFPGYHSFVVKSAAYAANDLIVSEVMYNPDGTNNYTNTQYIEIHNPSSTPYDLGGFLIASNFVGDNTTPTLKVPVGFKIPGHDFAVVTGNKISFMRLFPGMDASRVLEMPIRPSTSWMAHAGSDIMFFKPNDFDWDADFDNVVLLPENAVKVFNYTAMLNAGASDTGYSIELTTMNPGDDNNPANWALGTNLNGTPLAYNSVDPLHHTTNITITTATRNLGFPTSSQQVTITAPVTSVNTLASVKLYVNSGGLTWSSVNMTTSDNLNYSAAIGPFADGTLVKYYVLATDVNGASAGFPYTAPVTSVPFTVNNTPVWNDLVLNEIMYDPAGGDNGGYSEFLELYNKGNNTINLSYYQVGLGLSLNGANSRTLPEGTMLAPKQYLVLAAREDLLETEYISPHRTYYSMTYGPCDPAQVIDLGWQDQSTLGNGGSTVYICHPNQVDFYARANGIEFLKVTYDDAAPWPANGVTLNANSIELKDPALNMTVPGNWNVSTSRVGTPTKRNSQTPASAVRDWTLY